jgi:hypothetical protein
MVGKRKREGRGKGMREGRRDGVLHRGHGGGTEDTESGIYDLGLLIYDWAETEGPHAEVAKIAEGGEGAEVKFRILALRIQRRRERGRPVKR